MKDFKNLTIGEVENKIAELQELKEQIKDKPSWRDDFKGSYEPSLDSEGNWIVNRTDTDTYPNHYKEMKHVPIEKIALLCDMTEWARVHNEGWVADWNNEDQKKWGVVCFKSEFEVGGYCNYNLFVFGIALKSEELANQFYEEFKDKLHIINNK